MLSQYQRSGRYLNKEQIYEMRIYKVHAHIATGYSGGQILRKEGSAIEIRSCIQDDTACLVWNLQIVRQMTKRVGAINCLLELVV